MAKQKWRDHDQQDLVDILKYGHITYDHLYLYLYKTTGIDSDRPFNSEYREHIRTYQALEATWRGPHEEEYVFKKLNGLIRQELWLDTLVDEFGQTHVTFYSNIWSPVPSLYDFSHEVKQHFNRKRENIIAIESKQHYVYVMTKQWPKFVNLHAARLAKGIDWYSNNITADKFNQPGWQLQVDQLLLDTYLSRTVDHLRFAIETEDLNFNNCERYQRDDLLEEEENPHA